MEKCKIRRFTEEYSGCLELNPTCTYAEKTGFSYICTHPNQLDFISTTYETAVNEVDGVYETGV